MTAVFLHLSDIHIKTPNDPILKRGENIAACVFSSLPVASHLFIIVSGTFAFVIRAAQGANSDSLSEDVRNVVKKMGLWHLN
jgi:hypothetical protein